MLLHIVFLARWEAESHVGAIFKFFFFVFAAFEGSLYRSGPVELEVIATIVGTFELKMVQRISNRREMVEIDVRHACRTATI